MPPGIPAPDWPRTKGWEAVFLDERGFLDRRACDGFDVFRREWEQTARGWSNQTEQGVFDAGVHQQQPHVLPF